MHSAAQHSCRLAKKKTNEKKNQRWWKSSACVRSRTMVRCLCVCVKQRGEASHKRFFASSSSVSYFKSFFAVHCTTPRARLRCFFSFFHFTRERMYRMYLHIKANIARFILFFLLLNYSCTHHLFVLSTHTHTQRRMAHNAVIIIIIMCM